MLDDASVGGVVSAQRGDRRTHDGIADCSDQRGGGQRVSAEHDVVVLPGQGDELEVEIGGRGADPDIGDARRDRERDLQMRSEVGASNVVGWDADAGEEPVE